MIERWSPMTFDEGSTAPCQHGKSGALDELAAYLSRRCKRTARICIVTAFCLAYLLGLSALFVSARSALDLNSVMILLLVPVIPFLVVVLFGSRRSDFQWPTAGCRHGLVIQTVISKATVVGLVAVCGIAGNGFWT